MSGAGFHEIGARLSQSQFQALISFSDDVVWESLLKPNGFNFLERSFTWARVSLLIFLYDLIFLNPVLHKYTNKRIQNSTEVLHNKKRNIIKIIYCIS